MHAVLITVHAVTATVALLAGVAAFRYPALVGVHAFATVAMTVTLGGALWVGWGSTPLSLDVVFVTLLALAAVMSYRSIRAWQIRPVRGQATTTAYVAAVGFTCISLTTGLLAIAALRTGWGPVAVVVAGVLPTVIGRIPLNRALREKQLAVARDEKIAT
ncbi:hypothetical protein SAMN06264364_13540 [Quadrisphaera granulorum]|uniref:Uncharacterized protein n=1 Tax=Quadrisphaera granulorum TaxID=317664 RepID=A0A316AD90_9ACTN|nr:hypothetical protein [Quadrisphaera granulorum]PWJ47737.1 hypothetical protein BXY45_13540 [Quadrisphaera granulorum]SZE98691.1 hypothetical protein SAMN06264364_13540 [Quadrisphaera granulorum]